MKKYFYTILLLALTTMQTKAQEGFKETNSTTQRYTNSNSGNSEEQKYTGKATDKEISLEISVNKNTEISLENIYRKVIVKTWDKSVVKITTMVSIEGENKLTDDEWFSKLNLSAKLVQKGDNSNVRIKSASITGYSVSSENTSGIAVFSGTGENVATKENKKRVVTITIPKTAKLDFEIKYADLQIDDNIGDAKIALTNCNAEMQNVATLVLRSKYSNVILSDVGTAEVEILNGKFVAKNITTLDIDSKYSTVEANDVATATIYSTNDSYEMEEVSKITARKNYGNLRIDKLTQFIELEGNNADVKIRKISPTVKTINIINKYADLRLPLKDLQNYSIDFNGPYSTVYGNFENVKKKNTQGKITTKASSVDDDEDSTTPKNSCNCSNETNFTAKVGNGQGAEIKIKCTSCTVDFK